jgi:hypothetical protein
MSSNVFNTYMRVQFAVNRPSSVKDVADLIRYESGCSSGGRARTSKANAVGHSCRWAGIHPNVLSEKVPVVLCAEYRVVSEEAGAAALVANFAEKGLVSENGVSEGWCSLLHGWPTLLSNPCLR